MFIILTIIPRARIGYEMIAQLALCIISYLISVSGIIVLLKGNQEILPDLADFALQEQPEDNLWSLFLRHSVII